MTAPDSGRPSPHVSTKCSSVAAGDDPAAARQAETRTMTLAALCQFYLAAGASHKKPTTLQGDRGRIKNHIVPLLRREEARPNKRQQTRTGVLRSRPRAFRSILCQPKP